MSTKYSPIEVANCAVELLWPLWNQYGNLLAKSEEQRKSVEATYLALWTDEPAPTGIEERLVALVPDEDAAGVGMGHFLASNSVVCIIFALRTRIDTEEEPWTEHQVEEAADVVDQRHATDTYVDTSGPDSFTSRSAGYIDELKGLSASGVSGRELQEAAQSRAAALWAPFWSSDPV